MAEVCVLLHHVWPCANYGRGVWVFIPISASRPCPTRALCCMLVGNRAWGL